MITRNMIPASTIQQWVVGGKLPGLFLQHHRNIVPDRICQAIHAAHQHLRFALVFERPLADGTGQYFQQTSVHHSCGDSARATRSSSSLACDSLKRATTGTYQSRADSMPLHLTASFCVMSTGRSSPNVSSAAAKG